MTGSLVNSSLKFCVSSSVSIVGLKGAFRRLLFSSFQFMPLKNEWLLISLAFLLLPPDGKQTLINMVENQCSLSLNETSYKYFAFAIKPKQKQFFFFFLISCFFDPNRLQL